MRRLQRLQIRWVILLAWGLRLALALIVTFIGWRSNRFGLVLDDEASYYRATALLARNPLGTPLTPTLEHLGGNAYVGLTTALALVTGPSTLWARILNACLGTLVVLLVVRIAYDRFGRTAALAAGLLAALWPASVLWGAFMLRDTLVALIVIALWWSTLLWEQGDRWRGGCLAALCLTLLAGMREYVFALGGAALLAWAVAALVRGRVLTVVGAIAGVAMLAGLALVLVQPALLERLVHAMAYRQAVVQLEAEGALYVEPLDEALQGPYLPGEVVVLAASSPDDLQVGVVQRYPDPATREVTFLGGVTRDVAPSDLISLQDAHPSLRWVLSASFAGAGGSIAGLSGAPLSRPTALLWVVAALVWDLLLLVGLAGVWRHRRQWRTFVFPLAMVLGTLAILIAVPSGIGNAARHLTAHATPSLIVLAASLAAVRSVSPAAARPDRDTGTSTIRASPSTAIGPTASPTRSTI